MFATPIKSEYPFLIEAPLLLHFTFSFHYFFDDSMKTDSNQTSSELKQTIFSSTLT